MAAVLILSQCLFYDTCIVLDYHASELLIIPCAGAVFVARLTALNSPDSTSRLYVFLTTVTPNLPLFSGHTVRAVCESFQGSKDAGFKVVAHMMPDLPNVGLERDIEQFIEFFENPVCSCVRVSLLYSLTNYLLYNRSIYF